MINSIFYKRVAKINEGDVNCHFIGVKPFQLLMLFSLIHISWMCMVNLYFYNVERQAEPSISPDKWPAGVYHDRTCIPFSYVLRPFKLLLYQPLRNSKFHALTFITSSRIILGHLSIVM
jgi:hypothetical protein